MNEKLFNVFFYKNKYDLAIQFLQLLSISTLSFSLELVGKFIFINKNDEDYSLTLSFIYALSLFPVAIYKSFYLDIILDSNISHPEKDNTRRKFIYVWLFQFLISLILLFTSYLYKTEILYFILPNIIVTNVYIFLNNYFYETKSTFLISFTNSILFIAILITFNSILSGYCISNGNIFEYFTTITIILILYIVSFLFHRIDEKSISLEKNNKIKNRNNKNIYFTFLFMIILGMVIFNNDLVRLSKLKFFEILPYIFYITIPMVVIESFWFVRGKTKSDEYNRKEEPKASMYKRIIDIFVYKVMILLPLIACISLKTTVNEGSIHNLFVIYISLYYLLQTTTYFMFSKIYSDRIAFPFFGKICMISREKKWKLIELFFGFIPIFIFLILYLFDNYISQGKITNAIKILDFTPLNAVSILTTVFILVQLINVLIFPNHKRDTKALEKFGFAILFSVIIILLTTIVRFDLKIDNSEYNSLKIKELKIKNIKIEDLPINSITIINEKGKLLAIIYSMYLITITSLIFYTNIIFLKKNNKNVLRKNNIKS